MRVGLCATISRALLSAFARSRAAAILGRCANSFPSLSKSMEDRSTARRLVAFKDRCGDGDAFDIGVQQGLDLSEMVEMSAGPTCCGCASAST